MIGSNHQVSYFQHFQSCYTLLGFHFCDIPVLTYPSVLCGRYLLIFITALRVYKTKVIILQNQAWELLHGEKLPCVKAIILT